MDYKAMLSIFVPMGLAIAAFGSAIALGRAVAAAMEATLEAIVHFAPRDQRELDVKFGFLIPTRDEVS